MRATEFITEAPLADYVPLGDFNKPGAFRSKVDKKLVMHPTAQLKTAKFFEKTPYEFRLFFSNLTGTGQYSEYGAMDHNKVREVFKDQAEQIIQSSDAEDTITIVFVGNQGGDRVMLTPWIMAHRIGHAIQASNRRYANIQPWVTAERHFFTAINGLLEKYYNKQSRDRFNVTPRDPKWDLTREYNALFNAIGTQRSSREGQIKRPYEFLYEIFAQYLGTGTIKFNPLPASQEYGRKAWGRSTNQLSLRPDESGEDPNDILATLAYDMELLFNDVLATVVGEILVM
jgi:hypothetical protein